MNILIYMSQANGHDLPTLLSIQPIKSNSKIQIGVLTAINDKNFEQTSTGKLTETLSSERLTSSKIKFKITPPNVTCFSYIITITQGRLVAKINGGAASENHPIGLIFVTIYQLYTHTHTSPVFRQKETLITPAHKGRYCMSDSSLSTAALQSTANFKHHITGALKQKDFYIFFINLRWLLRLTLCII